MSSNEHDGLNLDFMNPIDEKIKAYLEANACGRLNAKKRKEIAARFGISDREVSQAVKDLIEVHGIMITTGTTGLFIPQTLDEYKEGRQMIIARIKSLVARVRKIDALIKDRFDQDIYFSLFDIEGNTSPGTPPGAEPGANEDGVLDRWIITTIQNKYR